MKKLIALLIVLSLSLALFPCAAFAAEEPSGSRILANLSNSPYAFYSNYLTTDITAISFLGQWDPALAGLPGVDVSQNNDLSVIALTEETEDGVHLYFYAKGGVIGTEDCSGLFSDYTNLKSVDFGGCFDTSNVKVMSLMFVNCTALERIDLSGLDTSEVQDMSFMFCGCSSLKEVNLSGLDMSSVLFINNMFHFADELENLDIPDFDASRVVKAAQFMNDGCTVNGQPWESYFTSAALSSGPAPSDSTDSANFEQPVPLHNGTYFSLEANDLITLISSRLEEDYGCKIQIAMTESAPDDGTRLIDSADYILISDDSSDFSFYFPITMVLEKGTGNVMRIVARRQFTEDDAADMERYRDMFAKIYGYMLNAPVNIGEEIWAAEGISPQTGMRGIAFTVLDLRFGYFHNDYDCYLQITPEYSPVFTLG